VKSHRIVLMAGMGSLPFAGMAWQVLHYLEGFRRLGYDVYYVEDNGEWPYDPMQNEVSDDCTFTVEYIARLMAWCGLPDRWAYRSEASGEVFGLSDTGLSSLWEGADVLINLTGATVLRDEHMRVPVRIYLETDPVLPQIEVAQGRRFTIELLNMHTHHFTFGENLGASDCGVPAGPFKYHPTRQPVILDWWAGSKDVAANSSFTTIGNWQQDAKTLEWNGVTYYWSKHFEFLKFIDLPQRTKQPLEAALACGDPEAVRLLEGHGWRIVDALPVSRDISTYHDYILDSRGEFTVAKDQNIRLRSGWFSDRSACYLAAGKPVITQDTAFGNHLPTGQGLFSFQSMDDILAALTAIESDYKRHSAAAYEVAAEYFAAERVLGDMMERIGL
jgi:hypothetical protein